ncbi:MAG: DUF692 family multinuclear iron-containing protein, partial [Anderseniella sp.]|nr:DUF692 family multinuclear iron-containing protein [Anderseniella sp.]
MTAEGPLGVGAVYIPDLHTLFASEPDLLTVLEVEPQTLWTQRDFGEQPYVYDSAFLARIAALPQNKLVHGVGFPVGGSRQPDPRHVGPLTKFIDTLDAVWASEHLAFNRAAGDPGPYDTGFLLPPLQTEAGIDAAVRSILSVQQYLPVPFAIETGVNYLRRREWEIEDAAFVTAVAERADCGILLDLHNIWTNEVNGRQPATQFMAGLPLDRVWEIHVAGGMMVDGYW